MTPGLEWRNSDASEAEIPGHLLVGHRAEKEKASLEAECRGLGPAMESLETSKLAGEQLLAQRGW